MLYEKVRELCKSNGISVSAVEKELGFGNGTITKWKNVSPNVYSLKKLADYFGVSIDYFLEPDKVLV